MMIKKIKIVLCCLVLFTTNMINAKIPSFTQQHEIDELVQTGIYYYWHGGDLEKIEKEFFKGITLKGQYDVVEAAFKKASELDPLRLNLKFALASTQIIQNKIAEALLSYQSILQLDPKNFNARLLHMMYSQLGEKDEKITLASAEDLLLLKKQYPEKTQQYLDKIARAEKILSMPLQTQATDENADFIITLGYALKNDGTMHEVLIQRLQQTLAAAMANPQAKIIVTGGVAKNGVTEAYLMQQWLLTKGIDPTRIILEDKARDTVENSLNAVQIMQAFSPKTVILISSASHIRRGTVLLQEAALNMGLTLKIHNLVYLDYDDLKTAMMVTANERLVIFRDLMRISGMWAYPGIQR